MKLVLLLSAAIKPESIILICFEHSSQTNSTIFQATLDNVGYLSNWLQTDASLNLNVKKKVQKPVKLF